MINPMGHLIAEDIVMDTFVEQMKLMIENQNKDE